MGYLMLGQAVSREPLAFSSGWNFGPQESLVKKVGEVISALQSEAEGTIEVVYDENPNKRHEAKMLRLDCTKAKTELGWRPRLNFEQSIRNTVRWYERWMEAEPAIEVMREQINEYLSLEK
jgi:CDP-glucose 4,6-dehydratase